MNTETLRNVGRKATLFAGAGATAIGISAVFAQDNPIKGHYNTEAPGFDPHNPHANSGLEKKAIIPNIGTDIDPNPLTASIKKVEGKVVFSANDKDDGATKFSAYQDGKEIEFSAANDSNCISGIAQTPSREGVQGSVTYAGIECRIPENNLPKGNTGTLELHAENPKGEQIIVSLNLSSK